MNFEEIIKLDENKISSMEAKNHNVLVFAFVGDAVFTLYVRELLASSSTSKAGILHTETSKFVKASFQAYLYEKLENEILNEEEKNIGKSARNSHTHNIAKNSSIEEYKKATSFESVLGYLYMTNQNDRLMEILKYCKKEIER
ncbi:MAG: Mini-ribonuclease 3 [Clostridiales bacterium]|nr:Mini-ribonuclease 3 [Candidatus Apopatousia equi]